ncbi:hypothetical protein [Cupriavidus necator]
MKKEEKAAILEARSSPIQATPPGSITPKMPGSFTPAIDIMLLPNLFAALSQYLHTKVFQDHARHPE